MDNRATYYFDDFTFKAYENLLINAKSFYTFITHNSYLNKQPQQPFLIWRHDLDMSIENAYTFAEIEHKLGIQATYFVHLHSEYYHFYEKETFKHIQKIQSLGHTIALHFDTHFYDINSEEELDKYINFEKTFLENICNCTIDVFSFHNTNEFILSCKKPTYGGLINAYADVFQKELPYCSDSYGVWRFERLSDIINQKKYHGLQVLTHPELWTAETSSPYQRIMNCIETRANQVKVNYDQLLVNNGRSKIDW